MPNEASKTRMERFTPHLPYEDFPLTPHPSGRWCKKINGKQYYYGYVRDGWEQALRRFKTNPTGGPVEAPLPAWWPKDSTWSTYFIVADGVNRVKIGKTQHLHKRLKQVQTVCPVRVHFGGTVNGDIEEMAHSVFKKHRVHGEWFEIDGDLHSLLLDFSRSRLCDLIEKHWRTNADH